MNNADWYNISIKVVLKNKKGQILILKNTSGTSEEDWHDLPGGRIDVDEFDLDYKKVISRELTEEIGKDVKYKISLDPVSFARHWYKSTRQKKKIKVFYILFEANYISGDIETSDEHKGFEWVDLKKLSLKKYFCKGMLEAIERYINLSSL